MKVSSSKIYFVPRQYYLSVNPLSVFLYVDGRGFCACTFLHCSLCWTGIQWCNVSLSIMTGQAGMRTMDTDVRLNKHTESRILECLAWERLSMHSRNDAMGHGQDIKARCGRVKLARLFHREFFVVRQNVKNIWTVSAPGSSEGAELPNDACNCVVVLRIFPCHSN